MFNNILTTILLIAMHLPNVYTIVAQHSVGVICKCNTVEEDNDECDNKMKKKIKDCKILLPIQEFLFENFNPKKLIISFLFAKCYFKNYYSKVICPPPNLA